MHCALSQMVSSPASVSQPAAFLEAEFLGASPKNIETESSWDEIELKLIPLQNCRIWQGCNCSSCSRVQAFVTEDGSWRSADDDSDGTALASGKFNDRAFNVIR